MNRRAKRAGAASEKRAARREFVLGVRLGVAQDGKVLVELATPHGGTLLTPDLARQFAGGVLAAADDADKKNAARREGLQ